MITQPRVVPARHHGGRSNPARPYPQPSLRWVRKVAFNSHPAEGKVRHRGMKGLSEATQQLVQFRDPDQPHRCRRGLPGKEEGQLVLSFSAWMPLSPPPPPTRPPPRVRLGLGPRLYNTNSQGRLGAGQPSPRPALPHASAARAGQLPRVHLRPLPQPLRVPLPPSAAVHLLNLSSRLPRALREQEKLPHPGWSHA